MTMSDDLLGAKQIEKQRADIGDFVAGDLGWKDAEYLLETIYTFLLDLYEEPENWSEMMESINECKAVIYMSASWWPGSKPEKFKEWADEDTTVVKKIHIIYDQFRGDIPADWQSGYVPNVVLTDNGKKVKVFAGNDYAKEIQKLWGKELGIGDDEIPPSLVRQTTPVNY